MTPQELVAGAGALGSLPESWRRLDQVVALPTATTDQIAEVVATDAGLSTRLLRLANSAMFGLPGRVERIDRAVALIGTRQIRDLALAACVIERFQGLPEDLVSMPVFWRHSLGCALTARAIGRRRREPNIERFFVVGLLHDIGCLLLYQLAPEPSRRALERVGQGLAMCQAERAELGFDHADVGRALLERWGLPQALSAPVGAHHTPTEGAAFRLEACVCHVASTITDLLDHAGGVEGRSPPLEPGAWTATGMDPAQLPDLVAEVDAALEPVLAAFFPGPAR